MGACTEACLVSVLAEGLTAFAIPLSIAGLQGDVLEDWAELLSLVVLDCGGPAGGLLGGLNTGGGGGKRD